jgi:probable F420-dependent oxidoreductase
MHLGNFGQTGVDIERLSRLAVFADELGVDRVLVSDHVLFGNALDAYTDPKNGGIKGGRQPTDSEGCWLEPLAVLAFIAARTQRIRLGTSILLAPLRRSAVLAKQLSTIDVMSKGRLDIGVGIGWQREEYIACDLDFELRGVLLDETLQTLMSLWSGHMEWTGRFAPEPVEIHQFPQPIQTASDGKRGVPLWISGTSHQRTIDRVVRFGTGWIPWGPDIAEPAAGIVRMRQALSDAGREPSELSVETRISVPSLRDGRTGWSAMQSEAERHRALGVTDLRFDVSAAASAAHERELIEQIVSELDEITSS